MKKWLIVLLCALLVLSSVACKKEAATTEEEEAADYSFADGDQYEKIGGELKDTMAMCGVHSLAEISRDCVTMFDE